MSDHPADCPHDTLVAATFDPPVFVPGVGHLHDLHAVYVCPACRDTFFFEAGIKRLNQTELLKLGYGFLTLAGVKPPSWLDRGTVWPSTITLTTIVPPDERPAGDEQTHGVPAR